MRGEPRGGLVDLAPREAVDDAGVARMLVAKEMQQLGARIVLVDDRVADVRAVEARDEHPRIRESQARSDLGARLRVGGGGQRDSRNVRVTLVQQRQLQVLGPEIVAPLRYAVRLVDGEQRDLRAVEQIEAARRGQAFGRHVEQVELARQQCALRRAGGAGVERGVEERRAHAELASAAT